MSEQWTATKMTSASSKKFVISRLTETFWRVWTTTEHMESYGKEMKRKATNWACVRASLPLLKDGYCLLDEVTKWLSCVYTLTSHTTPTPFRRLSSNNCGLRYELNALEIHKQFYAGVHLVCHSKGEIVSPKWGRCFANGMQCHAVRTFLSYVRKPNSKGAYHSSVLHCEYCHMFFT
jgi:hypothetical protein